MFEIYNPREIEPKWQKLWEEKNLFKVEDIPQKPKYYLLEMFPYPSGKIHMGHVRNYSIGDVLSRFKRMRGYSVLHPMGWDAFGLPAENAAIAKNVPPHLWTTENINTMRRQLKRLGFSYDWDRETATCHPEYYRWEQKFFIEMFKKGLVYRSKASVNWCPSCNTVLANEQVENGLCWRCDSQIMQKDLEQWFFKTTAYAEELDKELSHLTHWPDRVKTMQKNWIGKSHGCEIDFQVITPKTLEGKSIRVFTTRPDTLFGVTFISLAPEHPLLQSLTGGDDYSIALDAFVNRIRNQSKIDRTNIDFTKEGMFTGAFCLHPLTHKQIPVYVCNFVLMEYGTGAVMGVPAHDQRDFDFAKKYDLPIEIVIQPSHDVKLKASKLEQAYTESGIMVNSDEFNGIVSNLAIEKIADTLDKKGLGKKTINYRLKDWLLSRQRYWGTPIPIIHCTQCGLIPEKDENLPVLLPLNIEMKTIGDSPLKHVPEFIHVLCPQCGKPASRDPETMDTFVESSWYFFRYCSPKDNTKPFSKEAVNKWFPIDFYIGGIEHAVGHLIYCRFFTKVLRDLGYHNISEPVNILLTQGMVCKETYHCEKDGYLYPNQVTDNHTCVVCGKPVSIGRKEKMSKSKNNVIDPEALIESYGADTARLFSLFAAPPEKDLDWSEQGVEGAFRFLQRVYKLASPHYQLLKTVQELSSVSFTSLSPNEKSVYRILHKTIQKVTFDIEEKYHFNTAIASIMEFVNSLYQLNLFESIEKISLPFYKYILKNLILLLSPFTPHFCDELWSALNFKETVLENAWPACDITATADDHINIAVQINGKLRGDIDVAAELDQKEIIAIAKKHPKIAKYLENMSIKKEIYIPKKLINFVVSH